MADKEVKKALKVFKKDYAAFKKEDDLTIGFIVKSAFKKPSVTLPKKKRK